MKYGVAPIGLGATPFFMELSMKQLKRKTDRDILRIALPSIVSNLTVPLLGLVDVAIAGHLGAPAYIGAIAVGGMIFNVIYWVFGFLRMGTSGMTSLAWGRRDLDEVTRVLLRALGTAALVAFLLLTGQNLLLEGALRLIPASGEVAHLASIYFRICIWGAPAMLGLYAFHGWFIGMQNARFPMMVAITQNLVNIAASLWLVLGMGYKVEGVATGTLVAQYAGLLMAGWLWMRYYRRIRNRLGVDGVWRRTELFRFLQINRDIFLRTLCLVAVSLFFTSSGSARGEIILAVNTLLMQLFTIFSYFMDGFAYAGEALAGKHAGACNRVALRQTIQRLFVWGGGLALAFTGGYALGGQGFLHLLTDDVSVLEASGEFFWWAVAIPLAGFAAFLWDGIFIGLTATRAMFGAMLVASAAFFILYYSISPYWGNHALWLAFLVYLLLRGLVQTFWSRNFAPK